MCRTLLFLLKGLPKTAPAGRLCAKLYIICLSKFQSIDQTIKLNEQKQNRAPIEPAPNQIQTNFPIRLDIILDYKLFRSEYLRTNV